jgi:hypothetical protein
MRTPLCTENVVHFDLTTESLIRDKPIAPGSPWQNGYVERLIGTLRRECLDHMIVFGEAHLRRILGKYVDYYNMSRTHRALNKDAPFSRAVEHLGVITSRPVLGGLHHQILQNLIFGTHWGDTVSPVSLGRMYF